MPAVHADSYRCTQPDHQPKLRIRVLDPATLDANFVHFQTSGSTPSARGGGDGVGCPLTRGRAGERLHAVVGLRAR